MIQTTPEINIRFVHILGLLASSSAMLIAFYLQVLIEETVNPVYIIGFMSMSFLLLLFTPRIPSLTVLAFMISVIVQLIGLQIVLAEIDSATVVGRELK